MLRVYEKFREQSGVGILSHTIDTSRFNWTSYELPRTSRHYREIRGQFVTGKQTIFTISVKFMVTAQEKTLRQLQEGGFTADFSYWWQNRHIQRRLRRDCWRSIATNERHGLLLSKENWRKRKLKMSENIFHSQNCYRLFAVNYWLLTDIL
jgi:hypothetical protein